MKPLLALLTLVVAISCRADPTYQADPTYRAGLSGARAEADWGTVCLPQWEVTLRVPGGWRLDCPRGGVVARLVSPQGTEVLVRVWEGPRALTAAEAAAEYEQALGLEDTVDPLPMTFKTDAGLEGVWQELSGTGDHPLLALAVFSVGKRRIALTVRGLPDFEAAGRRRLEAMAASLQTGGGPPPGGTSVSPVRPGGGPARTGETLVPPGGVPPAAQPPPQPQTVGAFTVQVPPGFVVHPPRTGETPGPPGGGPGGPDNGLRVDLRTGGAGYFLFPLRTAPDASADEAFAAWSAPLAGKYALHSQRRDRNTMLYTLTLPDARRMVVYAWQQGDTALVLGVSARPELWKDAPVLAKLLGQTTCAGWQAAEPALPATPRPWVEGGMSLRLPQNWTARGGVSTYQKAPALDLTLQGDGIVLTWKQPYAPFFRDLTPILQATGRHEGEKYREGDEGDPLLILARRAPDKFVEWLLQQPGAGLAEAQVTRVEKSAAVAGLLPGDESEGAVVWVSGAHKGQPRERVYLCATAPLPLEQGAFRWRAAVLEADYPPGHAPQALAALRAILAAAAPLRPASATGPAVTTAVQAAAAAAGAVVLPPEGRGPWPLLGGDFQPVAGGQTPQWTVAAGLAAWRELVEKGETALPELAEAARGN